MVKGMVSIISPCYNKADYIFRLLDSILAQTYRNIQLILVDDGSTDDTRAVANSYKNRFEESGVVFEYYFQKNAGVSAAINEGLKHVKGEFLCWPDPDDWYEPESLQKRVEFLKSHTEFAIVSSDANAILSDGKTILVESIAGNGSEKYEENQFQLLLEGKSMICCICHMLRTEAFFETHPNGEIYNSKDGQNIQMLLPLYYSHKRGFLDEVMAHYLVLNNSLSHTNKSFEKELDYRNDIEDLTIATLNSIVMPEQERTMYIQQCHSRNVRRRLVLSIKYKNSAFAKQQMRELIKLQKFKGRDIIMFIKTCILKILAGGGKLERKSNPVFPRCPMMPGGLLHA